MKILYQLEKVEYFGYDPEDDENIEERIVLGHFSSLEKLTEAIEICLQNGINQKNIFISSFFDSFAPNQKYVYIALFLDWFVRKYNLFDSRVFSSLLGFIFTLYTGLFCICVLVSNAFVCLI